MKNQKPFDVTFKPAFNHFSQLHRVNQVEIALMEPTLLIN